MLTSDMMTNKKNKMPSEWFVENLNKTARDLPRRSPQIPVAHPAIGQIGVVEPGREFKTQGMSYRSFRALMNDEDKAFLNPRRYMKELGALTTWDGVLNARASGQYDDRLYWKASQTTVANNWSSFFRSGGMPAAGAYSNVPNGATMTNANTGAFTLNSPGANTMYLLNFGVQHMTGTNIVMLIDMLWAGGNILTSAAANTAVNTGTLTRYTDGAGVMAAFEVTANNGASAANIYITYQNTANAWANSAAIAMTASSVIYRIQPTAGGAMFPLNSGDAGIKAVNNVNMSANMGAGGIIALHLYKPLVLMPTLSVNTYVERSTPAMLSGLIPFAKDGSNVGGCYTVYVLTSTTSTGVQTYSFQTAIG